MKLTGGCQMTGFYTGDVMPLDFITKIWVQIYNQNEELCHIERKFIPICAKDRIKRLTKKDTVSALW
jgi:hypothetical protein